MDVPKRDYLTAEGTDGTMQCSFLFFDKTSVQLSVGRGYKSAEIDFSS